MSKLTQHSNPQYQSLINETSLEFVSYLIEVPNVIQTISNSPVRYGKTMVFAIREYFARS